MAKTFAITNAVAIAMADTFKAEAEDDTGPVILQIRTGSQPGPDETATGTLLTVHEFSATAFAGAVDDDPGALLVANAIGSALVITDGTAGHFRILTEDSGTPIAEGSCGVSDADLILTTATFVEDAEVSINSFTVLMPESA